MGNQERQRSDTIGGSKLPVFNVRNLAESSRPRSPEGEEAINWYLEQLGKLPEVKVEESPATDGMSWLAKLTPEGEVEKIEHEGGGFFSVEGRKITRGTASWSQPVLIQSGEWIETLRGEKQYVIGFALTITSPEGRIFLVVGDEPLAPAMELEGKEIRPVVKTPAQTSMTKMRQILEGDLDKDRNFSALLNIVKGEKDIPRFMREMELISAPTDANRMEANVLYGSLEVSSEDADKIQQAIPNGKFLTKHQIRALTEFGALNGITLTAIAVRDARGSVPQNGATN